MKNRKSEPSRFAKWVRRVTGTDQMHIDLILTQQLLKAHDEGVEDDMNEIRLAIAEIRGLLGLNADDVPPTPEEAAGRDPHGL